MTKHYFDTPRPHLLAHRGLSQHRSGLDENSVQAFIEALNAGCTHIESDVHATKDGVAVLFHDDDLDRVAGRALKISELTFSELSAIVLENGSQVPSLEEVLASFPDLKINLDIKSFGGVLPTVAVIERLEAHHRVLVSSFSLRRRKRAIRLLSRSVATSASAPEVLALWVSHRLGGIGFGRIASGLDALQIPLRQGPVNLSSASFIRRLRKHNLEVHYWTVNDPLLAKQLVDSGATGIVSDRVDLIRF